MTKNLWIDTDIGGDCDDAGALALADIAARDGTVHLLGMTFTTSAQAGPACMDAINRYYGFPDVPIGATRRPHFCDTNVNAFQEYVAQHYPNRYATPAHAAYRPVPDAVSVMRRGLSGAPDGSVTLVCIGQLNNASDLLDSPPDAVSALSGVDLVRKKVAEVVVMGGLFLPPGETVVFCGKTYDREYNIVTDIPSAVNFVRKCPVRLVFSDFRIGHRVLTGASLLRGANPRNPVTAAYRIFQNRPRESWDPLTVWYALYGTGEFFTLSRRGTVQVTPDGRTVFEADPCGNHFYLCLAAPEERCAAAIDQMLERGECDEKTDEAPACRSDSGLDVGAVAVRV